VQSRLVESIPVSSLVYNMVPQLVLRISYTAEGKIINLVVVSNTAVRLVVPAILFIMSVEVRP